MVPRAIGITEFLSHSSRYIDRVVHQRESYTLTRRGRPVAEVRPIAQATTVADLARLLRSVPHLTRAEADDFARDLDEARAGLTQRAARSPRDA